MQTQALFSFKFIIKKKETFYLFFVNINSGEETQDEDEAKVLLYD